MSICNNVPEILGKVSFRHLSEIYSDQKCGACPKKTVFALVSSVKAHDGEIVVYPCCRSQECYDEVIRIMEKRALESAKR